MEDRTIVGLVEEIVILSTNNKILARIDTGATVSSIDAGLLEGIECEEIGHKIVRSSHGTTKRRLVAIEIELGGKKVRGRFSVYDRSHMTYQILIGQDVLKQNFLIDPLK